MIGGAAYRSLLTILDSLKGECVALTLTTPYAVTGKVEALTAGIVTIHHLNNGTRSYVPVEKITCINVDKKVTAHAA